MTHSRLSRFRRRYARSLPMAAAVVAALLTSSASARAGDDRLADAVKGLFQVESGLIASPRPASTCGGIASCPSADGAGRQSLELVADVTTAPEPDLVAELAACEDMAKMMQPQTRKHCEHVTNRADATPRQRARAFTRLAYIVEKQRDGTYADFMAILAKAVRADPTYPAPRLARADYLILSNKSGAAMDEIKGVLKIDPNNAEAYVDMGRVHFFLAQIDSGQRLELDLAYTEITKAINLGAVGPDAYFYRGLVLEDAGRFLLAAQDYAKAVARYDPEPKTPDLIGIEYPLEALASALTRADRPSMVVRALAGMKKVRLPDFEKSRLYALRAEANDKIGKFADAAKDMATAARLALPQNRAALYVRQSEMLQQAGHGKEATKKMTEALDGARLRTVLQVQVYLRNHGFADVEITGKMDSTTHKAVVSCFSNPKCGAGISHFI